MDTDTETHRKKAIRQQRSRWERCIYKLRNAKD